MKQIKGTVSLKEIEFVAFHGIYHEERQKGNTFILSVDVEKYYSPDDLNDAASYLDYEKIYALAAEEMDRPRHLLESVCGSILSRLEELFLKDTITRIRIELRKKNPPIAGAAIAYSAFTVLKEY